MTTLAMTRSGGAQSWLLLLLRLRTFVALILVFAYFAAYAPNFLSAGNMIIITKHVALNAFLAIGMTFVIITGGIDLSVGSTVGLSAMVAGWLVLHGIDPGFGWSIQFNTFEIALLTCLVGVLIGAINGLLITRAGVAPGSGSADWARPIAQQSSMPNRRWIGFAFIPRVHAESTCYGQCNSSHSRAALDNCRGWTLPAHTSPAA